MDAAREHLQGSGKLQQLHLLSGCETQYKIQKRRGQTLCPHSQQHSNSDRKSFKGNNRKLSAERRHYQGSSCFAEIYRKEIYRQQILISKLRMLNDINYLVFFKIVIELHELLRSKVNCSKDLVGAVFLSIYFKFEESFIKKFEK